MSMVGEAIGKVLKDRDCLVIFFGSVARGDMGRTSDIDVGVYCEKELDSGTYFAILDEIEKLPMLRDVDLVDLAKVGDAEFLESVLTEGRVWIESPGLLKSLKKRLESLRKRSGVRG